MGTLWHDVRYGLRMLAKGRALTALAVVSLALGMGASTALFSIFDAVIERPLPVAAPDRLVLLTWQSAGMQLPDSHFGYGIRDKATGRTISGSFSYPFFEQVSQRRNLLSHVFAFFALGRSNVLAGGTAELAEACLVSGEYFEGLGLRPSSGRLLSPDDDAAGSAPVAVISHAYWQKRFGGDAGAMGRSVFVNGQPFEIVGFTPPAFYGTADYTSPPDIFIPLHFLPRLRGGADILDKADHWWFGIFGRLKPGVTLEQAQAALRVPFQHEVEELAQKKKEKVELPELYLKPGGQGEAEFRQRNRDPLLYALAVVGLVLLIACANVANLLLARAGTRQREIAVRLALGARRRRLIRQLLTESLLLAGLGGTLGVFLAWWCKELLFAWLPVSAVPETLGIPLDLRVLAFSGAVCVATALLFGLAPALRASRVDLVGALKENAGNVAGSLSRQPLGKAMVVGQVALSLMVLVAAGLFLRTLAKLERSGTGFNPEQLLTFRLDGTLSGYKDARLANLYDEVRARVERIPGVRAVGVAQNPLISGYISTWTASFPGYTPQPDERVVVHVHKIGGDFFRALDVPMLLGREFTARDDENAPPVAIVNETLARRYLAGQNPVGLRMDFGRELQGEKIEIVGVVRDMKYSSLRDDPPPTVYVPARQGSQRDATFLVRTAGDPGELGGAVRRTVHGLDPQVPVYRMETQQELIRSSVEEERETAWLSMALAALALVLAGIGLYGLLAHSVVQRTNEIGIRIALGASRRDIFRMVVGQGVLLVLAGVGTGLVGAYWATRLIESRLYGVTSTDPVTFAGVALLFCAVALAACYIPARRATRLDPMVALRYE